MKPVTKEELKEFLKIARSWADICRFVEIVPAGDNYRIVKKLILDFELTFEPSYEPWNKGKSYRQPHYADIKDVLTENSTYRNINSLRKRLINAGLKLNHCECCGISGDEVSLELHHINGSHFDNRLENLQILCPNCHSKTDNFKGGNIKFKKEGMLRHRPASEVYLTDEEIKERELERLSKRRKGNSRKKLEPKVCPICGKEFQPKDSTQKYCSQECYRQDNKGNRPSLIQLIQDFKELGSFVQVGNKYNVTDNAVRKWCHLYGIPDKSNIMKLYINDFFNK